jgi:Tol biopolymer transport system component
LDFEAKLNRSGTISSSESIAISTPRRVLFARVTFVLLLAVVAAALLVRYWPHRPSGTNQYSNESPLHSVAIVNWRNVPGPQSHSDPKFSPDGNQIAYSFSDAGNRETILVKPVNERGSGVPVAIDGINGSSNSSPIWSPDGEQLAFVCETGNHVRIGALPYRGGTATWFKEMDGVAPILKHWSTNGPTIFYELKNNLFALNLSSNEATQVTSFDQSGTDAGYFSLSPKEDFIAYRAGRDGKFDLWVIPMQGGDAIQVTDDPADDQAPYWLPDGERLLYTSDRGGAYQLCMAYVHGRKPAQLPFGEGGYEISDVSRDGSKILYTDSKEVSNISRVTTTTGEEFEITSNLDVEIWPDVSPDGKTLAFQTTAKPDAQGELAHGTILIKRLENPGQDFDLVSDGYSPRWLPDGSRLAFLRMSDSIANIWTIGITGGDEHQLTSGGVLPVGYTQMPYTRMQDGEPSWSSDASKVVYSSLRSGFSNVWMASMNGGGERNLTNSIVAGPRFSCPFWSPNNSEIAYLVVFPPSAETRRTWRVYVAKEEGIPRVIFESDSYLRLLGWSNSGKDVFIASVEGTTGQPAAAAEVTLVRVSAISDRSRTVGRLKSTYPFTIQLSPKGDEFAFVSRQQGKDDIWLVSNASGQTSKMTGNNNPGLYYSSPAWSPDGKTIYYGRHERRTLVSMIDNFR